MEVEGSLSSAEDKGAEFISRPSHAYITCKGTSHSPLLFPIFLSLTYCTRWTLTVDPFLIACHSFIVYPVPVSQSPLCRRSFGITCTVGPYGSLVCHTLYWTILYYTPLQCTSLSLPSSLPWAPPSIVEYCRSDVVRSSVPLGVM